jgi:hypothetical protein
MNKADELNRKLIKQAEEWRKLAKEYCDLRIELYGTDEKNKAAKIANDPADNR